jgi:hypothetical protein
MVTFGILAAFLTNLEGGVLGALAYDTMRAWKACRCEDEDPEGGSPLGMILRMEIYFKM